MKRRYKIMWTGLGAGALVVAFLWSPFSRVSLERATVVVPPAAEVHAPAGDGDVLTVVVSGDGGWADLDQQLGDAFAARGLPVLGINSFKYFWRLRSADEAAAQLDALLTENLARFHKQRIWMVGYSYGADVLPSIIDRLDPANRGRITQLVLLSPSRDYSWEIKFEGYMIARGRILAFAKRVLEKLSKVPDYPALPPVQALGARFPVECYYGIADADDSLCTMPGLPPWVTVHAKRGDHHFDGGYAPLAAEMMAALPVRPGPVPAGAASAAPVPGASVILPHETGATLGTVPVPIKRPGQGQR